LKAENFTFAFEGKGSIAGTAAGNGAKMLLCFHGYGQSRHLFQPFFTSIPTGWRVVYIDLPFFGMSRWNASEPITPADLNQLLAYLQEHFAATEVHVLAFSLGAKIALGMYQSTGAPIRSVTLISPDGLAIHPVYRFCIYNPIGKAIFYSVLRWPALLLFLLKVLYKLRITDAFKYQFVKRQFDKPAKRTLLKHAWQGFSKIRPDLDAIARKSKTQGTEWHVIWGAQDNVLPLKLCNRFIEKVNGAKLLVVDGGHFLLTPPNEQVRLHLQSMLS
jgi:pimeloyl-ACP methyl ester carboxylesterase